MLERKIRGILLYESQIERLFDDRAAAAAPDQGRRRHY